MDFLLGSGLSALGGLAYALSGYWKVHKVENVDIKKMLPTIVTGLVFGTAASFLSPDLATPQAAITAGLTGSVLIDKLIGGLK